MSKPSVAVALIVAAGNDKEAINLANCLGSINGYVDTIYIQLNARKGVTISPKVRAIAEQFTDNVFTYEWKDNFVDARNDIFSKVPKKYDWIMWLDSDDKVENPENIIPSLAVMPSYAHGVYILYDYLTDEFGNVVVSHWTSRVVRNNGSFKWQSSFDDDEVAVHETLNPTRAVQSVSNNEWKVVHQATPEHHRESLIRNVELLEGMFDRQSKKPEGVDPRIMFYLATHYYDAYNFRAAKELFYEYLKLSGWPEERSEAHVYMGKLLAMEGNQAGSRTAFLMAMGEYPENPGAYLELSKIESKAQRWEQAANWAKRGLDIKSKITPMVKYNHDYDLLTLHAQALSNLGGKHLTLALKQATKALKLRPFDPDAKANRDSISKLIDYRNNLRGVARLIRALKADKQEKKILPLLDNLPDELVDAPVVIEARQEFTPPKKWPKKSIAIYVGHGPLGTWGPWSVNEGGIGGSEEAVVRLGKELVGLGWEVTAFGTPGVNAGKFEGMDWRHYWEFNAKDTFDVIVAWRQPAFFDLKLKARKKYLWLHDVVDKAELTPERIKNVTKVIYVSKYHSERPENSQIKSAKKLASGNGISPGDFDKYDGKFDRDPLRCIYMSANERGLRILLDIWPDIKKEVPKATLDAYYGWNSFDAVNRDNPERMAWKATMQARMKELDGVTERGRIGQDDLNKEIFKSGIFAYPCFFPEVYAITYIKALAGGAHAVTSDFAVLKEYEQYATQVHLGDDIEEFKEEYKKALIHALKNPMPESERQKIAKAVREKYSWANTAAGWDREFS